MTLIVVAQTDTAVIKRDTMKFGESYVMGSIGRIYKTIKTLPVAVIYPLGPRQANGLTSFVWWQLCTAKGIAARSAHRTVC